MFNVSQALHIAIAFERQKQAKQKYYEACNDLMKNLDSSKTYKLNEVESDAHILWMKKRDDLSKIILAWIDTNLD
jgi:hypothetical protein